MRLLLVSSEPDWGDALRATFPAPDNVIACEMRQIAQNPALVAAADACFVAEATLSPATVEIVKQLTGVADTPLFVLTEAGSSQWEEAALFAGAQQVFRRPWRAGVIQLAISRSQKRRAADTGSNPPLSAAGFSGGRGEQDAALILWRDFSRLLAATTDHDRLLGEYLGKLRDVLGCGRALLYTAVAAGVDQVFRCAAASGVDRTEFESFELSQRTGLAQLLGERGTVLWRRRLRSESGREAGALRELTVFGAELAIPVIGQGCFSGILLVGPRISGTEYSEQEVALLYHAIEGLAALLARAGKPAAEIEPANLSLLQAVPIAAAVVTHSLRVVDTNTGFRSLLGRGEASRISYDDLPAAWAAAVAAAVQSRAASARVELDHALIGAPRKLRLSVQRMEGGRGQEPVFLVAVEDALPATTAAQEADAHSIHNLLQRAGEQLSNEFRNALTPVDIMVQLARDTSTSRGELERLSIQVGTAIHRLRRRVDDLAYLTKSAIIPERTSVSAIMRLTRERLDDWIEDRHLKRIVWLNEFSETAMMADSRALALALAELVMNGIEASDGQQVSITAEETEELISFRVRNSGIWSPPPESSGFRHRPFISSKSTGVGLGVEVASRVAENHGGRLLLGPVAADLVEAIMRVPRGVPAAPVVETRVARVL